MNLRLPQDDAERLDQLSEKLSVSRAQAVATAVREALQSRKGKKASSPKT